MAEPTEEEKAAAAAKAAADKAAADKAAKDAEDDEDDDDDADLTPEQKAAAKAAADALGDAGKQAIDRMKAKLKTERTKRRELEAQLAAPPAKKAPEADDKQPDADAIRAGADKAATTKANERILRSEIRAAAAGKLQDPKDALAHLDLSQFDVDVDGDVDEDEIADAIDELLKKKPYLGVTQGDDKRFKGTADGGDRGGKASKSQLTDADVKRLAAEGKHEEIEKARVDGRLNKLLGITP